MIALCSASTAVPPSLHAAPILTPLMRGSHLTSGSVVAQDESAKSDATGLWSAQIQQYLELIHIPKAGGSSLEAWGRAHGVQWGVDRDWAKLLPPKGEAVFQGGAYHYANKHWTPTDCPPYHIPRRAYVVEGGFDPYASSYTFCSVRWHLTRSRRPHILSIVPHLSTPSPPHATCLHPSRSCALSHRPMAHLFVARRHPFDRYVSQFKYLQEMNKVMLGYPVTCDAASLNLGVQHFVSSIAGPVVHQAHSFHSFRPCPRRKAHSRTLLPSNASPLVSAPTTRPNVPPAHEHAARKPCKMCPEDRTGHTKRSMPLTCYPPPTNPLIPPPPNLPTPLSSSHPAL